MLFTPQRFQLGYGSLKEIFTVIQNSKRKAYPIGSISSLITYFVKYHTTSLISLILHSRVMMNEEDSTQSEKFNLSTNNKSDCSYLP